MAPGSPTGLMEEQTAANPEDANALDVSLMARAGAGDHEAFRLLVERHQHAVVGTVAKMLGNPKDAEDIAQQVFLRLWRSAPQYRPEAKFTTFLFTITRNLVFNESRRKSRRKEISIEEREESSHTTLVVEKGGQPDEKVLRAELETAVNRAIDALPEAQRMAVVLRRYENMPYEEIARILEVSLPAVKSLLFRARTTLRDNLREYLES